MKIFPIWLKVLIVIVEIIIHISAIIMIMLIIDDIKHNPAFRMTSKTYYIDYTVKSNVYNLKDLSSEITPIVTKYQENPRLVKITYHFEGKINGYINGYITLSFYQRNYKDTKKAYVITAKIDIYNKKITEITKTTGEDANDDPELSNDEFIKPLEKDLASMLNDYSDKNATLEIDNSGIKIYHHIFKYSNISFD